MRVLHAQGGAHILIVSLGSISLGGCAATQGVLGGGYQREIDRREAAVADLVRERERLESKLHNVEQQRAETLHEESDLRQRLSRLRVSLESSRQILDSEYLRHAVESETLEQLEAEQRRLDLELAVARMRAAEIEQAKTVPTPNSELEADLTDLEASVKSHDAIMHRILEGK